MQVNTRVAHEARVAGLASLQQQLDRVQAEIASGKRIARPSDDPVGSGIATRLHRSQATDTARAGAVAAGQARLAAADTNLTSVQTALQRAREITLQGANATLSAGDRATLATETAQLSAQLLDLANADGPDGTPLYGGALATGPAFARDATTGTVGWAGAGGDAVTALGGPVRSGTGGAAAFVGPGSDVFALLDDLQVALAAPDATRAGLLTAAQSGLETAVSRAADAQAVVGLRAARLDQEAERLKTTALQTETALSGIESVDTTAAIARLQRLSTVLQAAQASFVKIAGLSLWDRL